MTLTDVVMRIIECASGLVMPLKSKLSNFFVADSQQSCGHIRGVSTSTGCALQEGTAQPHGRSSQENHPRQW